MHYWNTNEVKEGKLKCNKDRIRKTSQTMQLNREIKRVKLNIRKRNVKNTNKSSKNKEKIIIIHIIKYQLYGIAKGHLSQFPSLGG